MQKTEITTEGSATYCPEDNKLRLYVGRVPRDEYDRLRAEGWTPTPKQGCQFAAVWTPARRDTALEFAGIIEDEDQSPEDRAADRAERFAGYREKRTAEAIGAADKYDNGPEAHGYQSERRAARAAFRHDRIAGRACDAWGKAEYWQHRTAGVISHALHVATPGVRMGRIKTIEAELRGREGRTDDWTEHLRLRLAYETQMLEAQGGRAAFVEMEVGGWIGGHQIRKVNKSNATGRVVSVTLKQAGSRWNSSAPGFCLIPYNIERLPAGAYRPPTDEDKAALADVKQAEKAARPAKAPCPLVNPTDADADRLQAEINARVQAAHEKRNIFSGPLARAAHSAEFKPATVLRITQAQYSAVSKGSYARAETRGVCRGAIIEPRFSNMYSSHGEAERKARGPKVCEVRTADGNGSDYNARRVVILTDKGQKAFPVEVWTVPAVEQPAGAVVAAVAAVAIVGAQLALF